MPRNSPESSRLRGEIECGKDGKQPDDQRRDKQDIRYDKRANRGADPPYPTKLPAERTMLMLIHSIANMSGPVYLVRLLKVAPAAVAE